MTDPIDILIFLAGTGVLLTAPADSERHGRTSQPLCLLTPDCNNSLLVGLRLAQELASCVPS